jgi:DNA-binding MarR family transcriptional regulator
VPPLSGARRIFEKSPTRSSSRQLEQALDLFAENPYWSVSRLAERLHVAFTTAQRAIDRLESAGIVALVGDAKRSRVYCTQAILDILGEPPRVERVRSAGSRRNRA